MKRVVPLLLSAALPLAAASAPPVAETRESITVPTPAEFFAAIDKANKPDWASFYRDPVPTAYPTRSQTAFNLGALVTDGFVAAEAQDGQQVKNIGKDIIALARALGVGEDVLGRGKSISDFADSGHWRALSEELEATVNEVRAALAGQRDESLSWLITSGAWLRALQVGAGVAERSREERAAELLRQRELISCLRQGLTEMAGKARAGDMVQKVDEALAAIEGMMPQGGQPDPAPIAQSSGALIAEMSKKKS